MDWDHAIRRNSEVLAGIVADLFVMLGLVTLTDTVSRLPWPTYRAVLRVLRPAESALRRLIVVAARGLAVKPMVSRPGKPRGQQSQGKRGILRVPSFQLFDPQPRIMLPRRRNPKRVVPRIHFFNTDGEFITIWPPIRPAKAPARPKSADGMVNAARVIRRLEALESALADIAAPGPAPGPLADAGGEIGKPQFQIPAPSRPSAGLPQAGRSPRR